MKQVNNLWKKKLQQKLCTEHKLKVRLQMNVFRNVFTNDQRTNIKQRGLQPEKIVFDKKHWGSSSASAEGFEVLKKKKNPVAHGEIPAK